MSDYTPRAGSRAAQAVAWIAAQGEGAIVTSEELAAGLGIERGSLAAVLSIAVRYGALIKPHKGAYRLPADGEAAAADDAPAPFLCGLWSDGDLSVRIDGEDKVIPKADADVLRAYLAKFPTPAIGST